jgi:hypothetical protein
MKIKPIQNFKKSKRGASNVEIIVWISVVLVIATILFLFRDAVISFINNAINNIKTFKTS